MKLSLIQMNSARDRDANVARACQFIDQAAREGSDLIVLPEFFNTLFLPSTGTTNISSGLSETTAIP